MTEKSIHKEISQHGKRNRELRSNFEQKQVDLVEARPIEFQFWARSQRDAAVLARVLYEMGFLIRLLSPTPAAGDPERWAIEAGAKIPLERALGSELTEKLVRLASKEDAIFDGWGATV